MDIMIDIESLNTTPDCVILTIGAVLFDPRGQGIINKIEIRPTIEDQTEIPRAALMMEELYHDNEVVIHTLIEAYQLAGTKHLGLANFLQDRIDVHEKHGWMLRSLLKVQRA